MKNILEEYKPVRSLVNSLGVYQSRYMCPLSIRRFSSVFTINMQACLEVVSLEVGSVGWLEVGVESVVLLPQAIPVRNPQEVIQLALMMVLVGFFVQADVMFEPVEVDYLQLVITSVLYLVGNLRHLQYRPRAS